METIFIDGIELFPIQNYEGIYYISKCAKVYSLKRKGNDGRFLSQLKDKHGYLYVKLCFNFKSKNYYIHRLIAKCFIQNPLSLNVVNHKDMNPLNNQIANLEWVTKAQNNQFRKKTLRKCSSRFKGVKFVKGKRRKHWMAEIKYNGQRINIGYFINEIDAAKAYNSEAIKYFKQFAYINEV